MRMSVIISLFLLSGFITREASAAGILKSVLYVFALAVSSYFLVTYFIEAMIPLFQRKQMSGKDICKKGTPEGDIPIPEPLGLVPAAIYILMLCVLHVVASYNGDARLYTAAMACVTFMTLLGFADDVLDLKWRYKLVLPLIASLPLLVNYTGKTTVILPHILRPLAASVGPLLGGGLVGSSSGRLVDLGFGYYVYMALLSIFCTNAINIYAGINGLEAGQSLVIAVFIAIHNTLNLRSDVPKDDLELLRAHHAFSLDMMLPFIGVTLGLLRYNWYPSRVFVGDTFCYFAGMTFAMASVLGHYSTTLLLFFVPQLVNFIYSLPQLIGIIPCPRHRLPTFNKETRCLEGVKSHWNLVNLVLLITGPISERNLCLVLLGFQVISCCFGLAARQAYIRFLS